MIIILHIILYIKATIHSLSRCFIMIFVLYNLLLLLICCIIALPIRLIQFGRNWMREITQKNKIPAVHAFDEKTFISCQHSILRIQIVPFWHFFFRRFFRQLHSKSIWIPCNVMYDIVQIHNKNILKKWTRHYDLVICCCLFLLFFCVSCNCLVLDGQTILNWIRGLSEAEQPFPSSYSTSVWRILRRSTFRNSICALVPLSPQRTLLVLQSSLPTTPPSPLLPTIQPWWKLWTDSGLKSIERNRNKWAQLIRWLYNWLPSDTGFNRLWYLPHGIFIQIIVEIIEESNDSRTFLEWIRTTVNSKKRKCCQFTEKKKQSFYLWRVRKLCWNNLPFFEAFHIDNDVVLLPSFGEIDNARS